MRNFLQKHTIIRYGLAVAFVASTLAMAGLAVPAHTYAQSNVGNSVDDSSDEDLDNNDSTENGVNGSTTDKCPEGKCIVEKYINPGIKAFAALAGVAVAAGIVIGGIEYTISTDDPSKVSAAKDRITKSIIALLAFMLLFAFLNYIVPGGIG